MSSRRLMSVWQALHATHHSANGRPSRDKVKEITSTFTASGTAPFSGEEFESHFKENSITFDDYVNFVKLTIKKSSKTTEEFIEKEIEEQCWSISKNDYLLEDLSIQGSTARMLWEIFNQLCEQGTLPPTMDQEEANWIAEKISSRLGQHWNITNITSNVQFAEFLKILDEKCFLKAPSSAIEKSITEIHSWLVKEIIHSGWLYKCSFKLGRLHGMDRKWFVLKPGHLIYYHNKKIERKEGEILIGSDSKVEHLPKSRFNILAQNCQYQFMLRNPDNEKIEFAAVSKHEKMSWMDALNEVIQATKMNESPLQLIFKGRMSLRQSIKDNKTDNKENSEGESQEKVKSLTADRYKPVRGKKEVIPQKIPMDLQDEKVREKVNKIQVIFCNFDKDNNGAIDRMEFGTFLQSLGLKLDDKEIDAIFSKIEDSEDGIITMDEFTEYFMNNILDESGKKHTKVESDLQAAFLKADHDGTGTIDFKEFTEYITEMKRNIKSSEIMKMFSKLTNGEDEMSLGQFEDFIRDEIQQEGNSKSDQLEGQLMSMYREADAEHIAQFLHDRWTAFSSFQRAGASGEVVMTGGDGMVADVLPGQYSLIDLACYSDLPPITPRYIQVKNVCWIKSSPEGHGKVIFPPDFDGLLPVDIATTEHLRHYGASLADSTQVEVSLMCRHGIQDFTYGNNYLEDYVEAAGGGCGLETHAFSHLDCPLQDDSGYFVIGKMVNQMLHLTAFKVPTRHTLYLPGGIIHSNDYMKGTWRTMLSDASAIDHCHIMKRPSPNDDLNLVGFNFTFENYI